MTRSDSGPSGIHGSDLPAAPAESLAADSRFGPKALMRLRTAFEWSRHPMLIADDQRRWVTGNNAACELLGIARTEVPWHSMDDFTPPAERTRLEEQWQEFLSNGAAEGWYELYVPDRGSVPVEFSATANVLPARHLSVFIPPETSAVREERGRPTEAPWSPVLMEDGGQPELTRREREVMTLVAHGLRSTEMAERLVLSPETIKTHVRNAMTKLGSRTRAHAVAIALVTGQITWES